MSQPFHVLMVCTGNICRSIMAEIILRAEVEKRGLDIVVSSAGVSTEETGHGIDYRAQKELRHAGYELPSHRAHQATEQELRSATLILAMTSFHQDALERLCHRYGVLSPDIRLFRSFDPECEGLPHVPDVDDPWYGGQDDFAITRATLERCTPPLLDYIEDRLQTSSQAR